MSVEKNQRCVADWKVSKNLWDCRHFQKSLWNMPLTRFFGIYREIWQDFMFIKFLRSRKRTHLLCLLCDHHRRVFLRSNAYLVWNVEWMVQLNENISKIRGEVVSSRLWPQFWCIIFEFKVILSEVTWSDKFVS